MSEGVCPECGFWTMNLEDHVAELCDVCGEDISDGGSHWHCGHCGELSSQYGHFVKVKNFAGYLCAEPRRVLQREGKDFIAVEVMA